MPIMKSLLVLVITVCTLTLSVRAADTWTERAYPNLVYYNKPDKGGHFAAWEQPEPFSSELRAALQSLR